MEFALQALSFRTSENKSVIVFKINETGAVAEHRFYIFGKDIKVCPASSSIGFLSLEDNSNYSATVFHITVEVGHQ